MTSVREHLGQAGIGFHAHKFFNRRLAQVGVDQERALALLRVHHGEREGERRFPFAGQSAGKEHASGLVGLEREHEIAPQMAHAFIEKAALQAAPPATCNAQAIGPILVGMDRPVHVLQRLSEVPDIVNMAVIAAVDALEYRRHARSPK